MSEKTNELSLRIVKFVGRVVKLVDAVGGSFSGKKTADQLVRCSTSVGANYEEAHGTGSRALLRSFLLNLWSMRPISCAPSSENPLRQRGALQRGLRKFTDALAAALLMLKPKLMLNDK